MTASAATFPPLLVTPPAGGFDRAAARDLVKDSGLATALHKLVRAPFGHTVVSLRALDAAIEAADLALQAGEALHAALLEDIARAGSLALPEPTRDQRMFVGAFTLTVLGDVLAPRLALVAPTPEVHGELESDGLEDLLVKPTREGLKSALALAGKYLEVQAQRQPGATAPRLDEREVWAVTTLHAFVLQLAGALRRLTHAGRLRPFGVALAQRKVVVGELRYEGFVARGPEGPASDLKPVKLGDIVGNQEYLQAGLKLARDVAAYDLKARRGPKQLNPVLFGLGRPGCGKTITAHAIGNYFLDFCKQRDVPARFKVIRRTDWASSYQNASAATLVKIFKEEVYGFEGVCGVYWPDIDTAFASRGSGDLRSEEKNNLGAVFGIFDGTLIPKDGKWFMICDANYMQMDEATRSRIAQNPFTVRGPTTADDYVHLLRDVLLGDLRPFVAQGEDAGWAEVGAALVKADLSGRSVESVANNIRAYVQDFEYPDEYFRADYEGRKALIHKLSRRVDIAAVQREISDYVSFHREAEEREAKERFEREVEAMVGQLNAGRAATARAAAAAVKEITGE
ncbi:AAA family ATPase [Nannocystis radixulma]|uniref:AAA family ATPase n=1 Tax=Nannocystis radixulma TaxID=2995305 RepID=A0ABT5BHF6_9BACT|nr:AAA family ATPase [Nannocystis radixulma]MDC0673527.1 AAA family ATPase [Nannocystis radixulma]